jgi:hypothetical protein
MQKSSRRAFLILGVLPAVAFVVGCSGGGGGGGGTTPPPTTFGITGVLKDTSTGIPVKGRVVAVKNDATHKTTTDASTGAFTIVNIPTADISSAGLVRLVVSESTGFVDGEVNVDVAHASGNPKNVGTVNVDISGSPPPPPL